jgi:O-antigen/teichoic acid export membrane protein
MSAVLTSYFRAGGVTLIAKIFAAVASLAEIYFLNLLLGKADYGAFVYALTIVLIVGIVIGNPMRSLILYRLSKDKDTVLSTDFFKGMVGITILLGIIATLTIFGLGWQSWIIALAVIAALEMVRVTLCAGLQASHNIPAMTFFNTLLPYAVRMVVLIILAIGGFNSVSAVAGGYAFAFIVPIIAIMVRYKIYPKFICAPFARADLWYGLKIMFTQLVHQNSRYIDVILIGSIGLMTATADYVVALKFATLLLIGKQLTQGLITPRMASGHIEPEYSTARFFEIVIAVCGIIGFACIGGYILPFFGDYETVQTLFFLCAASMMPRVMTGSAAEFLSMKGHAGWVLFASLITLKTTITAALILIPIYGAMGSGMTAIIGATTANIILWFAALKTERFNTINGADFVNGGLTMGVCIAIGLGVVPVVHGAIGISLIFTIYLIYNRKYARQLKDFINAR